MSSSRRRRIFTYGIPFFTLVVGGSFGLRHFSQVRYDYRGQKSMTREEVEDEGIQMKPAADTTIEKQFAKVQSMDIDTWENKRGPRPWEANVATTK